MEPIRLIATYARVSTARQEEEQTIQAQIMQLKEEAQKKNYAIVKEYSDDGWSGDTIARPGLDQLRADSRQKIFDAVLIYDPDRLARRYSYQELVMDELKEAGIEVMFITVSTPKNSEDKILHGVRGLFAEYERAKITERFRIGKLRKIKEGHILTTEALYGYTYIKRDDKVHGYYIINEEEAKVVRMIFTWVADEGITLRGIVKRLQHIAILPRRSKRGVWSTSTLSTMLRHRGYVGEAHYGKSYAVVPEKPIKIEKYKKMKKTSRKVRPETEWHIVPIPAIIDSEVFERAGRRLTENFALCVRNRRNEYLLANKIWCVCGGRRAGEGPMQGKHLYYRCNNRVLSFPLPRSCFEKGINARIVDALVWDKIATLMSSPKLMGEQIARKQGEFKSDVCSSAGNIEELEKEHRKLKEQDDRFNTAYAEGLYSIEKLKEYLSPIRERMNAISKQIADIKNDKSERNNVVVPAMSEIESFAVQAMEALQNLNFTVKRKIVLSVVDKVVATQGDLQVYGHISINSNVGFIPNHRHGQSTIQLIESVGSQSIPFEFKIQLPPPLKSGVDYGFRSSKVKPKETV